MIKSAPRKTIDYITPGSEMPVGYSLDSDDFLELRVKRENLVEFGTAYCVAPATIKKFMRNNRSVFSKNSILLNSKYYD